jgi:flagellin-like hook-associated protein FlgL
MNTAFKVGVFGIKSRFAELNSEANRGLVSLLPNVSAGRTLQSAARANAAALRAGRNNRIDLNSLDGEARLAGQRATAYGRLSSKLTRTVNAVEKARDKLLEIKDILSDMRKQITLAQSGTIDDSQRRQHANEFDRLLGSLNIKARNAAPVGSNLIGNRIRDVFSPDTLTYKTKPNSPVSQTVKGIYSGSDYQVIDGGGVFLPDLYGSILQAFPETEGDTGELVAADDTVDFDSGTGALSITRNGESTPFLTGTVERKGLAVLHSFLYGNFTDATKRDEALSDLDAASSKLRFNLAVLEGELAKVSAHRDFNKKLVADHSTLAGKAEQRALTADSREGLVAQRQQLLFASTFRSTLSFDRSGGVLTFGTASLFDFKI